jgi:hypothetical protein
LKELTIKKSWWENQGINLCAVPYPSLMFDVDYSQEGESTICVLMVTVSILATKSSQSKIFYCKFPVY